MAPVDPIFQRLTVVMYHYVRPVSESPFPRLKALELNDFIGQLDWLSQHYSMISPTDLKDALRTRSALPARPCLLTFDDGYSDHFSYAFPELKARGLTGLFFAPYSSLVDRKVLEVNKIQFVLASLQRPDALADELDQILRNDGLGDPTALRSAHFTPNRYDCAEVAYVKRLLQHGLPPQARSFVVDALFHKHVTTDEAGFADDLYLNVDQAIEMRANGMEFGGHGDEHLWHAQSSVEDLGAEVLGSKRALEKIGAPVDGGFYCYPFGSQNDDVRSVVGAAGFQVGFTVEPSLCDPALVDPLRIPRLDTRDLPFDAADATCPWLETAGRVDNAQ